MHDATEKVRLDKWLWAARFFKTRALATEAVDGGKVHVNGQRAKPSRTVNIGDELSLRRGVEEFTVIVKGVSDQRRPAKEAALLYEETPESLQARAQAVDMRKFVSAGSMHPGKRPNKKDRREIMRFTGKGR